MEYIRYTSKEVKKMEDYAIVHHQTKRELAVAKVACGLKEPQKKREVFKELLKTKNFIPGMDFSYTHLGNLDITEVDLSGINFRHTSFDGSVVLNSNLSGVDITWGSLKGCSIVGSNLEKAKLLYVDADNAGFEDCSLQEVKFNASHLWGVSFIGDSLEKAIFQGANLRGTKFTSSSLLEVSFKRASLSGVQMYNCLEKGINLAEAALRGIEGMSIPPLLANPPEGELTGFIKECYRDALIIVKIPKEAKRFRSTIKDCLIPEFCEIIGIKGILRGTGVKVGTLLKNRHTPEVWSNLLGSSGSTLQVSTNIDKPYHCYLSGNHRKGGSL